MSSFFVAANPIVYLTIQDDPATHMSVHGIVNQSDKLQFYIKEEGQTEWKKVDTEKEPIHFSDVSYYVANIKGLSPATRYNLTWDKKKIYQFRTVDPKKMVFLVGGDVKINKKLLEVNQTALMQDPDFIVLCGDIGYSELFGHWIPFYRSSYPLRLLHFLKIWFDTMQTDTKRLIPLLCTIGNHDVKGMFHQPKEKAALFYDLFFPKQNSYRKIISPLANFILLDSGHTQSIHGKQVEFLEQNLIEQNPTFVFYHLSSYPSTRRASKLALSIRQLWTPIFEKNQVPFVFEHHDHSLKRTYAMKRNLKDEKGIVFLGDGAWSASPRRNQKRWYLQSTHKKNGFWKVNVTAKEIKAQAVDANGTILDQAFKQL